MTSEAFERIVQSLDTPMLVVTAISKGERSGCLVGFHTRCSIAPPRWIVCISKRNHTYRIAAEATSLALHVLRADQRDLAVLFGDKTSDLIDKFARCTWQPGTGGTPILDDCDWIAGMVSARFDCGDHTAYILDIVDAEDEHHGGPDLVFSQCAG